MVTLEHGDMMKLTYQDKAKSLCFVYLWVVSKTNQEGRNQLPLNAATATNQTTTQYRIRPLRFGFSLHRTPRLPDV